MTDDDFEAFTFTDVNSDERFQINPEQLSLAHGGLEVDDESGSESAKRA